MLKFEYDANEWHGVAYINPDKVSMIASTSTDLWRLHCVDDYYLLMNTESKDRLLVLLGYSEDAPGAPAADGIVVAHIIRARRDSFYSKTSGTYRLMMRCTCAEGYEVNVFDHQDPLRDTFSLFREHGYDYWNDCETDTVLHYGEPGIEIRLKQDGQFWKVIRVVSHDTVIERRDNPKPSWVAGDEDDE